MAKKQTKRKKLVSDKTASTPITLAKANRRIPHQNKRWYAAKADVEYNKFVRWLRGDSGMRNEELTRIAAAIGLTIIELTEDSWDDPLADEIGQKVRERKLSPDDSDTGPSAKSTGPGSAGVNKRR
jgi:hypothetical protein